MKTIGLVCFLCLCFTGQAQDLSTDVTSKHTAVDFRSVQKNAPLPSPPEDGAEIRILPTTNIQAELSVAVHPLDSDRYFASAITSTAGLPFIGVYWSSNGGLSWQGSDFPQGFPPTTGDPAAIIDRNGYFYVGYLTGGRGQGISRSLDDRHGRTIRSLLTKHGRTFLTRIT